LLVTATDPSKVKAICSLLPCDDEETATQLLKARPDLDLLFTLNCNYQDLSAEQQVDPSSLTINFKASKLWRVLRGPVDFGESPWDWNWNPPCSGTASQIVDEFHVAVCRAVFRIPFLDLVKWALEFDALFVSSLFAAVDDVSNKLEREILNVPVQGISMLKSKG
jgi:hypothetical protein